MIRTLPRRTRIIVVVTLGLLVALLALLVFAASFPASWLKAATERRLSERIGTTATIGTMKRESAFSLSPVIQVRDVRVPQPAWAGNGDLARIEALRLKLPLVGMLLGSGAPQLLSAQGVRLTLVRDENRRKSWDALDRDEGGDGGGEEMPLVRVDDAVIDYRDAFQQRRFTISLTVDPQQGLRGSGKGTVEGEPVTLRLIGAPMRSGRTWPFDAHIMGEALNMHARGTMAGPLRTSDMTFKISARASNLKLVDRIIEAGLFGTQPVDMSANVQRRDGVWRVADLGGRVGRSRFTGALTVRKVDGRTKLDGEARFSQLDFEDLADDKGLAAAVALERAQGQRLVPNTRINIRKIDTTDGRIAVQVDRILDGRRPSSLANASAVLNLDNRILTVDPLRIGLTQGVLSGRAVVDQRDGQPKPTVTLALDMRNSSIAALAGGGGNSEGDVEGRVDARAQLTGVGDTIREAVGQSNGTVGAVTRGGSMPARLAGLLGFDIGKGLFGDEDAREALRCGVIRMDLRGGRGAVRTLVVDTAVSQTRGTGTVSFPAERLDLTLNGLAKSEHALQLPGDAKLRGTIRNPELVVPEGTRSVGNILKAVGRAIGGRAETAADADCASLIARTLGD
ncbi:MAG: AsmA family protein [Alphaproteobacteria bacterium]|nr:AsmA family protein [Alphaproteobacteria bacterium]MBU0793350.1 AsmA family protein [Alphaproteobacteria bacterium]MBU0876297.1 AsmA family protein [Alphaproteobacteria bacterium]MBU1768222.1 AsmA family protein [Alphaproteobacteria bacterium]